MKLLTITNSICLGLIAMFLGMESCDTGEIRYKVNAIASQCDIYPTIPIISPAKQKKIVLKEPR